MSKTDRGKRVIEGGKKAASHQGPYSVGFLGLGAHAPGNDIPNDLSRWLDERVAVNRAIQYTHDDLKKFLHNSIPSCVRYTTECTKEQAVLLFEPHYSLLWSESLNQAGMSFLSFARIGRTSAPLAVPEQTRFLLMHLESFMTHTSRSILFQPAGPPGGGFDLDMRCDYALLQKDQRLLDPFQVCVSSFAEANRPKSASQHHSNCVCVL